MIQASLAYAKPLQHDEELSGLVDLLRAENVRSYLEIGTRYGGTFETVMRALPRESRGTAIDFPGGAFGDKESVPILLAAIKRLRASGRTIDYVFGPSDYDEVRRRAAANAPYDAILIDGDHAYDAVRRDFEAYAPMGRIIILHDIVAPADLRSHDGRPVEVPRLWREIKDGYRHQEILAPDSVMGIGVIWRDA